MVLPVTGPTNGSYYGVNGSNRPVFRQWSKYRQTMPIDRPLPYWSMYRCTTSDYTQHNNGNCFNWYNSTRDPAIYGGLGPYDTGASSSIGGWNEYVAALNGARSAFEADISERANAMVNALQYNQALDLASKGLTTVRRFISAVKRGNLKEAERVIKWNKRLHELRRKGKHGVDWHAQTGFYSGRTRASTDLKPLSKYSNTRQLEQKPKKAGPIDELRDASEAWLTYSYGLAPAIKDVFTGIDIVSRDHYHRLVPRDGTRTCYIRAHGGYLYTTGTPVSWEAAGKIKSRVGALLLVTNPNYFKLEQLGLTNPLLWLYEATPWSFVLDWFINVEEFLSSMSPKLGYELFNPWTSAHVQLAFQGRSSYDNDAVPGPLAHQTARVSREMHALGRATSIPAVKLRWKGGVLTSLPRALNAASLLGVQLRKGGPKSSLA